VRLFPVYSRAKVQNMPSPLPMEKLANAFRQEAEAEQNIPAGKLCNLPALREIGFQANRRLLDVQTLSHDCTIGEQRFQACIRPTIQGTQRASGLSFGDPRMMALRQALCLFLLIPAGFANVDLRVLVAWRGAARPGPRLLFSGADDLRPPPLATAWPHRANASLPSVCRDADRDANRALFRPDRGALLSCGLVPGDSTCPHLASDALSQASQAIDAYGD